MSIGKEIGKQKGTLFVNRTAFNDMSSAVNTLRKITFDPKKFTISSNGYHVGLRNNIEVADPEYHFKGEVTDSNVAAGVITIHGGIARRYSNNTVNEVKLTTDDGPSEHYEDVYTLNDVTSNKYIYAELDDPLQPTTLTINNTASDVYPVDDANKYTIQVLGRANCDSGSVVWEPYYVGGDYTVEGIVIDSQSNNDIANERRNYSTEYSNRTGHEGELQDYGWSNNTSQVLDENDYVMVKTIEDPGGANEIHKKRYCTLADLANSYGVTITVVIDVRYDSSTHQLQKKTVDIKVLDFDAVTAWQLIEGGQATVCT